MTTTRATHSAPIEDCERKRHYKTKKRAKLEAKDRSRIW